MAFGTNGLRELPLQSLHYGRVSFFHVDLCLAGQWARDNTAAIHIMTLFSLLSPHNCWLLHYYYCTFVVFTPFRLRDLKMFRFALKLYSVIVVAKLKCVTCQCPAQDLRQYT